MSAIPIFQVDSFTNKPFAGNPAGVCLLERAADGEWMQHVAREMNLSETAFVFPRNGSYDLRWFTPTTEVNLCGHATLATAHILWEQNIIPDSESIKFQTRSGELVAVYADGAIELNFPADPIQRAEITPAFINALGATPVYLGKGKEDYIAEFSMESEVRAIAPDFARLAAVTSRGVIVTSPSDHSAYDFVSRFFAPAFGINEDPVTGSAHCSLACFWSEKLDKISFTAFQASSRGGVVKVTLKGDRVVLGGQAVTVLRGSLAFGPQA